MQVTVRNDKGEIIAVGEAESGIPIMDNSPTICTFPFTVKDIPRSDFYSISIGKRGQMNYSFEEMKEKEWEVAFTLGN